LQIQLYLFFSFLAPKITNYVKDTAIN